MAVATLKYFEASILSVHVIPAFQLSTRSCCYRRRHRSASGSGLGYNEQSYGSAASLAGNRAGNYVGADLVDQGPTIRECQKPDSDARIGMALPQTIAGVSVARAPLILPSPTSTAGEIDCEILSTFFLVPMSSIAAGTISSV